MYNKGLHEILITKYWDILPLAYHAYKEQMTANMTARIPLVMEPEKAMRQCFCKVGADSSANIAEKVYAGDPEYITWRNELEPEDQIVNVLFVNGPITRGGGACSYGSKEFRDRLMEAADTPQVIGHVICIDSPGGSSMAKYDFQQAIDYVHDKGQKVVAFVDGQACSAGYAIAALCDEIYFMHPSNDIGCIGTMCAFSISHSGDENAITKETYIELYAEGSPYKNREYREAAEGNYDALMTQLNASADDFKNMVRAHRPQVTDEQLLGDTYPAGEVIGTLVDGQNTLQGCIERIIALTNGTAEGEPSVPAEPTVPAEPSENSDYSENSDHSENSENSELDESPTESTETINNNQTPVQMNKDYLKIREAVNNPALQSDKNDALFLTADMCEALEQTLAEAEQKGDTLDAKIKEIETLNGMIETMKADHAAALDAAKAEHDTAMDALKTEHAAELKTLADTHAAALQEVETKKAEVETQVADLNEQLTQAKADLEAKETELNELSQTVPAAPKPAEAPADDNTGVAEKKDFNRVCRPGMTAAERRAALEAQMEAIRRNQNC